MRLLGFVFGVDAAALALTDRIYLWIHDRTGAPKGAVMALPMGASTISGYYAGSFTLHLTLCLLGGCGLFCLFSILMQSFESEVVRESIASGVQEFRDATWRRLLYPPYAVAFFVFGVYAPLRGHPDQAWALTMPVVSYLAMARVRERRPPERRSKSEDLPATEAVA